VLFKEFCRLEAFPADQSVQLYPLQANLKKATALLVMRFGLYRTQAEQLRAHSRESLRQPQGADEQIVTQ